MSKRTKKNKYFSSQNSLSKRKINIRDEHLVKEDAPFMLFSFKDFQYNKQIPPGQSYTQWQEKKLLAYMLDKFGYICNKTRVEAEQENYIKVYYDFPANSRFKNPFPETNLNWAVIMKIKGQKARVVGHIIGTVFYVVFLDAEHVFFPLNKK
ncbi:MAG: hypothetical protein GXO80_08050 [Chlorobi bacterium]|nr:hypothetical protein [Chlorobiota bacterium]